MRATSSMGSFSRSSKWISDGVVSRWPSGRMSQISAHTGCTAAWYLRARARLVHATRRPSETRSGHNQVRAVRLTRRARCPSWCNPIRGCECPGAEQRLCLVRSCKRSGRARPALIATACVAVTLHLHTMRQSRQSVRSQTTSTSATGAVAARRLDICNPWSLCTLMGSGRVTTVTPYGLARPALTAHGPTSEQMGRGRERVGTG